MIPTDLLAEIFVNAADTLVDDFDVIEFLETLTNHTAQVSSASSAGLLLANPEGQLHYVASSAESVKLLELFQLQYREGPCLDCFQTGEPVVNADLSTAHRRWPLFAPQAVAAGYRSVHAFPLRHQRRVIGAMNLFSSESGSARAAGRPDHPVAGRHRDDRAAAGAHHPQRRDPRRAAPEGPEQPDHDRAGQGRPRQDARHRRRPRLPADAPLRPQPPPPARRCRRGRAHGPGSPPGPDCSDGPPLGPRGRPSRCRPRSAGRSPSP